MKNFFLTLSGLVFGLVATLHLVRVLAKWPVVIGTLHVPLRASVWACLISLLLALGCFLARGQK